MFKKFLKSTLQFQKYADYYQEATDVDRNMTSYSYF